MYMKNNIYNIRPKNSHNMKKLAILLLFGLFAACIDHANAQVRPNNNSDWHVPPPVPPVLPPIGSPAIPPVPTAILPPQIPQPPHTDHPVSTDPPPPVPPDPSIPSPPSEVPADLTKSGTPIAAYLPPLPSIPSLSEVPQMPAIPSLPSTKTGQ